MWAHCPCILILTSIVVHIRPSLTSIIFNPLRKQTYAWNLHRWSVLEVLDACHQETVKVLGKQREEGKQLDN